ACSATPGTPPRRPGNARRQQPQRPPEPAREPRQPRQRSANPMKIPGLGCLKGCLFTIVLLFVAGWLVWELTPLQDWIGTGRSYWHEISHVAGQISGWVKDLSSATGN
ncbi:serine/threonine protein kinase, partial [Streptomyces prunicolor]